MPLILSVIDVCHRKSAASYDAGDLAGIDSVVLGLPAVYGFHV
jgi:hypothetical protein